MTMIRALLLTLAVGVAVSSVVSAKKILGAGVSSCREWEENRATGSKESFQQRSWIAGFLSGYNVASSDRDFLANKPDAAAIYAWIDSYCRSHPLDNLSQAVTSLKDELLASARR